MVISKELQSHYGIKGPPRLATFFLTGACSEALDGFRFICYKPLLLYVSIILLLCTTRYIVLFVWFPYMAINVSVQYYGGLLPDIILLTQCYYYRGTRFPFNLNASKPSNQSKI